MTLSDPSAVVRARKTVKAPPLVMRPMRFAAVAFRRVAPGVRVWLFSLLLGVIAVAIYQGMVVADLAPTPRW